MATVDHAGASLARFLSPSRHATPLRRVRVVAKHDPLSAVPRGDFKLSDFSYQRARLCQTQFGNCRLRSLRVA
jgi:hypothetical protein